MLALYLSRPQRSFVWFLPLQLTGPFTSNPPGVKPGGKATESVGEALHQNAQARDTSRDQDQLHWKIPITHCTKDMHMLHMACDCQNSQTTSKCTMSFTPNTPNTSTRPSPAFPSCQGAEDWGVQKALSETGDWKGVELGEKASAEASELDALQRTRNPKAPETS